MRSVTELAGEMYEAFQAKTRDNGDTFHCLKSDSPEWMTDVCHAGHGDMFPDDFRYSVIREACGFISDNGEDFDIDGDDPHEFADDGDVYNGALLAWVSSNLTRMSYVDDALEEYECKELARALMVGQSIERREIFDAVAQALQAQSDESDDA